MIKRRKTRTIKVGDVLIGGNNPISIQSMTNTETCDEKATKKQINNIKQAGADIVRVSVPTMEAAQSFNSIVKQVTIPIVADIHFDHKIALAVANSAACLRINPGNIGNKTKIKEVINAAQDNGIPIRIGINAGSIEKKLLQKYKEPNADALVESAISQIELLNSFNFTNFKLSLKASDVLTAVAAYQKISAMIDNPLHLGITEAGSFLPGSIKSSVGLGSLLLMGIGDTIRISLAADPIEEVKICWEILKALKIRSRGVNIIACPSCSRQNFDVIKVVNKLENKLSHIEENLTLSIIGCIVNGPGEAKMSDIGLTGGNPQNLIYINGKPISKIDNNNLVDKLYDLVEQTIKEKKLITIAKG